MGNLFVAVPKIQKSILFATGVNTSSKSPQSFGEFPLSRFGQVHLYLMHYNHEMVTFNSEYAIICRNTF